MSPVLQESQYWHMIKRLSQVAQNTDHYKKPISTTLVGVISDATSPMYREKESNYIVMLKIIDETMNEEKLFGVMSKDCAVYLISKNKAEIDLVNELGAIVLLDKFSFSLWNDIKLEAKYQGITEGLFVVESDQDRPDQFKVKKSLCMNPDLMIRTPELAERVRQLEKWRFEKMRSVISLRLGVRILNNHCVMVQPFNMALKVVSVSLAPRENFDKPVTSKKAKNEKPQEQYEIRLTDFNGNKYYLFFERGNFEPNDFVYVRGIKSIGQSLQIILTRPGNVLKIIYPLPFECANYMAIHRDNQRFTIDKQENEFTVTNCESMERTYIADLAQLQDKYNHHMKKEEIHVKDAYLVEAIAVNYEGLLQLYHRDFQVLLHDQFYENLSLDEKKECKEMNRIGYVFEGLMGLIDRSNEAKGVPFYVHLFTCDAQGNFLCSDDFENAQKAIGTLEQGSRRNQLEKQIHNKLKNVTSKSSFEHPAVLVLEPIRSQKLLFRIVNTKFL